MDILPPDLLNYLLSETFCFLDAQNSGQTAFSGLTEAILVCDVEAGDSVFQSGG